MGKSNGRCRIGYPKNSLCNRSEKQRDLFLAAFSVSQTMIERASGNGRGKMLYDNREIKSSFAAIGRVLC